MDSIYSRYASALLSIAREEKKVNEYKDAMKDLMVHFKNETNLQKYLESYFVNEEERFKFIDELVKPYKLNSLGSFLKLLSKKHRIFIFDKIAKEFIKDANEDLGILEGFIYSTEELTKDEIKKVEEAISKKLDNKVELKNLIDTRLLGGVKVVVHDHVFDGSLKGKLNSLRNNLNERRNK